MWLGVASNSQDLLQVMYPSGHARNTTADLKQILQHKNRLLLAQKSSVLEHSFLNAVTFFWMSITIPSFMLLVGKSMKQCAQIAVKSQCPPTRRVWTLV